jgi:hypothetical protein
MKIARDTPLMELTLRRYERPSNLNERELVRKFCLSIGLLQPGDSRDVVVDVLYVLLAAKKDRKKLSSEDIKDEVIVIRKNYNRPMMGIASSNIRRQIKRLKDILIVEKVRNSYRITEFADLSENFENKIEQFILPTIVGRVKEYFKKVDNVFS